MNDENLTHKLTASEQREGGIRSGEARRERKKLRDGLEAALAGTYTVNGITADGLTHVCVSLVRRAMEGDPRAFCALRDSLGERPTTSVEVDAGPTMEQIEHVRRMLEDA